MSPIGKDEQSIIEANNLVAVDLYSRLAKADENLFISPFSILTALHMAYAGARKDTAAQMEKALHIKIPQDQFHQIFNRFSALLDVSEGYELTVANALSMKIERQILDSYKNLIKSVYRGEFLEFSVGVINNWVSRQTRGHINRIVDNMDAAVLVLVNAIYFRGLWDRQFEKENTRDSDFFLMSGKTARVPLMHQMNTFRYTENPSMQILEMVYKGHQRSGRLERVSMVIYLPKKRDGLAELERGVTAEFIQQTIASLRKCNVDVFFPRFSLETAYGLNEPIKGMGIAEAFTPDADFSGMTADPQGLRIDSIIHKATIDVDEKGTVATAATALLTRSLRAIPFPVFRADHPFLFLLRDVNAGIILFIGKLMVPIGPTRKRNTYISSIKTLAARFWGR
jgi:serpin B